MIRVYVAGAYSSDKITDMLGNMRRGIALSVKVLQAGYAPFCPWLDFQFGLLAEIPLDTYYEYSMTWLRASDAVLLVPGWEGSVGVKAEMEEAKRLGIPVFWTLDEMKDWTLPEQDNRGIQATGGRDD